MPSWLQGFATYQPFSVTVSACRSLMVGAASTGTGQEHLVLGVAVRWPGRSSCSIVFIPLAIRRYRTRT